MAFKLYPPVIGARIPAFYQDSGDNLIVTIPFVNNRSVSKKDVRDIVLRIKTIQTDWVNLDFSYTESSGNLDEAWNSGKLIYKIPRSKWQYNSQTWKLNVGQFYKIQIAYKDKYNEIGYYSSIGVSKFSFYPDLTIQGLSEIEFNTHDYNYIGKYSQMYGTKIMDTTEKAYYYRFEIYNAEKVIKDTGWLLHNSEMDENEYTSYDTFEYLNEIPNDNFCIKYSVQTTSGIIAESPEYKLEPAENTEESDLVCAAKSNFDDGFVEVSAKIAEESSFSADKYYVIRNIKGVNDKCKIAEIEVGSSFKDFTVEQGIIYEYTIYGLKDDIYYYSNKSEVEVDYEDIFLFDGERQLKVRYNPSVNSMSETIMESKVDTIGGKYPIFLRNGDTRYRNFSFGGLITYNMDENGYFDEGFSKVDYSRESTNSEQNPINFSSTKQGAYNYKRERDFREKVLAWLNNGQPKLYRSSTEGIKMVRLMSVSLTPNTQVSRMVWSFSATATESSGHEYEDLIKNNIYKNV